MMFKFYCLAILFAAFATTSPTIPHNKTNYDLTSALSTTHPQACASANNPLCKIGPEDQTEEDAANNTTTTTTNTNLSLAKKGLEQASAMTDFIDLVFLMNRASLVHRRVIERHVMIDLNLDEMQGNGFPLATNKITLNKVVPWHPEKKVDPENKGIICKLHRPGGEVLTVQIKLDQPAWLTRKADEAVLMSWVRCWRHP